MEGKKRIEEILSSKLYDNKELEETLVYCKTLKITEDELNETRDLSRLETTELAVMNRRLENVMFNLRDDYRRGIHEKEMIIERLEKENKTAWLRSAVLYIIISMVIILILKTLTII